jgi:hypothetical protein
VYHRNNNENYNYARSTFELRLLLFLKSCLTESGLIETLTNVKVFFVSFLRLMSAREIFVRSSYHGKIKIQLMNLSEHLLLVSVIHFVH